QGLSGAMRSRRELAMMVRARKALLVVAAAIPCAALADGLPAPPPAPPPPVPVGCCEPFVWTGVYLGIQAGAAWGEPRWSFPFLESFNTAAGENISVSASGAAFGGHIGGNYQIGNIVLGAEVAYSENGEFGRVTGPFTALPFERFSFKTTDLFTASG